MNSNQYPNHHGDGSVLPSNEFPESQSCPYCLQKHLPMYTTCASPPQLVRPHRTYLTPDSPFSPLRPEGPSTPVFPLRPISPEIFSFNLIFSYFPRNGNGINDKAGWRWCPQGFRVLALCSGGTGWNTFHRAWFKRREFFKRRSCEHHYESFSKFLFCTRIWAIMAKIKLPKKSTA